MPCSNWILTCIANVPCLENGKGALSMKCAVRQQRPCGIDFANTSQIKVAVFCANSLFVSHIGTTDAIFGLQ